MKKIINIVLKVILCIVIYVFQIYVFNKIDFFGVTASSILSLIVVVAMLKNVYVAGTIAFVFGCITDIIFGASILQNVVIYLLVVAVISSLKSIYKQDRKTALIILVLIAVVISQIVMFMYNIQTIGFVNILSLILNIVKQSVIDIFLAYVIYIVITRLDKIEE